MKVYKLTDNYGKTRNNTHWGENVTNRLNGAMAGIGPLCTPAWIHCYTDWRLAVFFNPAHAQFTPARMWLAKAEGTIKGDDEKLGCTQLTTIREIPVPVLTKDHILKFTAKVMIKHLESLTSYERQALSDWCDGLPGHYNMPNTFVFLLGLTNPHASCAEEISLLARRSAETSKPLNLRVIADEVFV